MHILLVNTNPVISRLMFLILRNDKSIVLDEVSGTELPTEVYYDILFVDEKCCSTEEMKIFLQRASMKKKILLTTSKEKHFEGIDYVIRKPFLPSEITSVIQSFSYNEKSRSKEKKKQGFSIFTSGGDKAEKNDAKKQEYQILDSDEMEKIKQLLFDESLSEISHQTAETELFKTEKEAENRDASLPIEQKETNLDKKLLEALMEMKPRKIRKLLEGAEVSINIRFPKEV
jgi:hypothetical protein